LAENHSESNREDYEKHLSLYEQNLEVQERTVTTRQEHETVYDGDPEMVTRWQETYDKHPGEITWVERNIYLPKQRNLGRATGEFGDFLTPGWISRPSVRGRRPLVEYPERRDRSPM
jgi:hypothetical protein